MSIVYFIRVLEKVDVHCPHSHALVEVRSGVVLPEQGEPPVEVAHEHHKRRCLHYEVVLLGCCWALHSGTSIVLELVTCLCDWVLSDCSCDQIEHHLQALGVEVPHGWSVFRCIVLR